MATPHFTDGDVLYAKDLNELIDYADDTRDVAETARDEAVAAKTAAETARSQAQTARTEAQTARTQSQAAQSAAETAKEDSEAAKTAAESASSTATSAQSAAETARTEAQTAKTQAEAATTAAQAARSDAIAASTQAEAAKDTAVQAAADATAPTEQMVKDVLASLDTGWVDCVPRANYRHGAFPLQVRRINGIVYIRGSIRRDSGSFTPLSTVIVANLPSADFYPEYGTMYIYGSSSGAGQHATASVSYLVGDISLRIGEIAGTTYYLSGSSWLAD